MRGPVGVLPEALGGRGLQQLVRRRRRPPAAARPRPARRAAWFRRAGCLSVPARRRRFRRAGRPGSCRRRCGSSSSAISRSLVLTQSLGVERLALDPDREDAEEGEHRAEHDQGLDRASPSAAHREDAIRDSVKLEGIHHITAITEDAQRNVDFYAGVLGLRLVKKTVNQDNPTVYHLFFADEKGSAGSDLTFFEFPGVPRGRAGAGDGPPDRLAGRLRGLARLLGGAARRQRGRVRAGRGQPALLRPRGARPRAGGGRGRRRAADRRPPRGPGRAGAAGLPRRARLQRRARRQPRAARGARVRAGRRGLGGARREARRPLPLRRAARRARAAGRRQRPPRRLGLDHRRARGVAREGDLRPAPSRPR